LISKSLIGAEKKRVLISIFQNGKQYVSSAFNAYQAFKCFSKALPKTKSPGKAGFQ